MQKASAAYKNAMKKPYRNRAYITARIGIVSSVAQDNVVAEEKNNDFAYFSNQEEAFKANTVSRIYATGEQDFSKIDGSMYFLPPEDADLDYYNNGIVTAKLLDRIYISFDGNVADIKGVTIDFGEMYPELFELQYDGGKKAYSNAKEIFVTEDTFDAVTYMIITPLKMVNGNGRLRIYQFICGISNTFSNKEVKNFTYKEYASEISESLPSQDMTLTVDNQNLYYNPSNHESAISYLEQGQELKARLGYDVDGSGTIEWLPEFVAYLKTWSATDTEAKFTMVDVFDWKLTGTYYGGQYYEGGINLYDLAIDVLTDAGLEEDKYSIDPYLKDIIVYNPLPVVTHAEALQIIANAGRCILSADRHGIVKIFASFIPDMSTPEHEDNLLYPDTTLYPGPEIFPTLENTTIFGEQKNVLISSAKEAYAMASNDFSVVDGSINFIPRDKDDYSTNIGYVSGAVADNDGNFGVNPVITIDLEAAATFFGFTIKFRNVAPEEFVIKTYYQSEKMQQIIVSDPDIECNITDELSNFDRIVLEFTKGHPNARITVDNVLFGDMSDYSMNYDVVKTSPVATQEEKVMQVDVIRHIYGKTDEVKNIFQESIDVTEYDTYTFYFTEASYDVTVAADGQQLTITESSSYFVTVDTSSLTGLHEISVDGKAYSVTEKVTSKRINSVGVVKTWKNNVLISTEEHAQDMVDWLSDYYYNSVNYSVSYAGEPRIDSGDIVALETKRDSSINARIYEHEITFNGAFSGTAKIRKTVSPQED